MSNMSQFLYNHTKYRCDQKLKIYDPKDRSLSGLYNKNLKQAKPLYIKSSYNPPGTYNFGKKNKKMNDILNKYMKDYEKLKKNKDFEKKNEDEIDDETFKNINNKINKLFFKDDIYEEEDLINPDFLIDRFEDEKEDSKKKSLLINKNTELDYENRKNDNYEKNKEEDDNIYDENNKNIVKDGESDEEYNNFDIDKVEMIQKKYRSHCKKKIEQNLKNYFTGFDNSGEYVNFIYLDKNEVDNNNIQNIYYKVYSCKNQSDSQKKYNINELYEIKAIEDKNLTEDYINDNKKKIANTIFKEYCKKNNIAIQEDNSNDISDYNFDFDHIDNKFEESIKDDFEDDKLKDNKVIEEHADKITESIQLKNDSLNKPIVEPIEDGKKEDNIDEYFDNEEIQEKPVDERENSKEEIREVEKSKENIEEYFDKEEVQQKPVDERENSKEENREGEENGIQENQEEKKIENNDNNVENNNNSDVYYFNKEEIEVKPGEENNSEEEKINKEIEKLN